MREYANKQNDNIVSQTHFHTLTSKRDDLKKTTIRARDQKMLRCYTWNNRLSETSVDTTNRWIKASVQRKYAPQKKEGGKETITISKYSQVART